jgi:TolA-binding protein
MKSKSLSFAVMLVSGFITLTIPAAAQNSSAVNSAKIEVLERQVRMLRSRLGMNPPAGEAVLATPAPARPQLMADLSAKIGSLEGQIRKLTGRLEEFEFRQREMKEEIEILRKDLALQRQDIAAGNPQGAATAQPVEPVSQPVAADGGETLAPVEEAVPEVPVVELPEGDAATQYKYAFSFVQKNDLASGRVALEKFLEANAGDARVGNAKFWLGRIHMRAGRNAQAAQMMLAFIEEHPNHKRRADALVDFAEVLVGLDAANDACNALAEFRRVEGNASARVKSRADRLSATARCS